MGDYESIEDLGHAVDENGGLLAVTLGDLREILNYSRLGAKVLNEIAEALRKEKLGYFPRETLLNNPTPRFTAQVRIYRQISKLGELIEAVVDPDDAGDELLRNTATGRDSYIVNQLRILLAE